MWIGAHIDYVSAVIRVMERQIKIALRPPLEPIIRSRREQL